jgi:FkbM family methyltransferase
MKLRLWRHVRQIVGYAPLTVAYGEGGWIAIDERDWLQSFVLANGAYEPEVWNALARYAQADEVVWDVGAYIGTFALTAAQHPRVAHVCAFEPDPQTLETLRTNLALNAHAIGLYPFALSDRTETRTLIRGPAANAGMSTFGPSQSTGMRDHVSNPSEQLPTFDVACFTADELVASGAAPAPTLIKLDVEGWEYAVLNGARGILESTRLKAVVFETGCDAGGGILDGRVRRILIDHGYLLSHIERPGSEPRGVENYLAVRP